MAKYESTFVVNITGDVSLEKFPGTFRVKTRMSHGDQLRRDQLRRELLGADGANASTRAQNQATIFAELMVRVIDGPAWFKESNSGLDLADDNVIKEVYDGCVKAEADAQAELTKAAEEAKKELAKEA